MAQQLKSVLSVFLIAVLMIAVVGVPISFHDCSLSGQHKFQSGFFSDHDNGHCVCCTKTEQEDVVCEHQHEGACCDSAQHIDNSASNVQENASFAHAACCNVKTLLLELSVVAQQIADAIQKAASSIVLALTEVFHRCILFINEFIPLKDHYPPPGSSYKMPADTFLYTQFLL